jgi:hypothetical protein
MADFADFRGVESPDLTGGQLTSPPAGDAIRPDKNAQCADSAEPDVTPTRVLNAAHARSTSVAADDSRRHRKMGWILGIIYFVLMVTLGLISLRKGHWVMFIVGLFIPLFWLIGALMPPRRAVRM